MPNPYRPRQPGGPEIDSAGPTVGATVTAIHPGRVPACLPAETLAVLDQFLGRLRILGATVDELAAVVDGWDQFDEEWTPEYRHRLAVAPDLDLLAHLRAIRDEHHAHTTTEEEAELERLLAIEGAAKGAAVDVLDGGTVADVVAWVKAADGDDRLARAYAVELLEAADRKRKGILDATRDDAETWDARMVVAEQAAGVDDHTEAG